MKGVVTLRSFRSIVIACAALCLPVLPAAAATRALVVASDYADADPGLRLANAAIDGRTIFAALKRAGISDVRLIDEPKTEAWQEGLAAFLARLEEGDTALLYYAGHGVQVSGLNYFLAADGISLLPTDAIVQQIANRSASTIIIIDACRNNPFRTADADGTSLQIQEVATKPSRGLTTISVDQLSAGSGGLAQLSELRGMSTVVLFSTDPGNVALDGEPGEGSPFARMAAVELGRRQSLNAAFRGIATAVNRITDGAQSPWRQGDLPKDVFLAGMPHFPVP